MRFITEFELEYPYTLFQKENLKFSLQEGLGNKIAESFQWKEIGYTRLEGPVKYKASIEIEAFPTDKWIEFKKRLLNALPDYDVVSRTRIFNALSDLESVIDTQKLPG